MAKIWYSILGLGIVLPQSIKMPPAYYEVLYGYYSLFSAGSCAHLRLIIKEALVVGGIQIFAPAYLEIGIDV